MTDATKWKIFEMFLKKNRMYSAWIREPIHTTSIDMPSSIAVMMHAVHKCGFSWLRSNIKEDKIVELNRKWIALCRHFEISDVIVGTLFVDRVRRIQLKNTELPEW